jgi:hypothetical protein
MNLALPTGFEPVIFRVRNGRPGPLDDGSMSLFALKGGGKNYHGSRRTIRTYLPPLTAERPHRDGSTGMKWWRQSDSNRPQLVCKTGARTLRCPRIMAPEDGIEPPTRTPSTCRSTPELPRRNSEWRGPAESNRYHCAGSARHSQYTRSAFSRWWVTAESNRARAKAQALQARSVTRLGVTLEDGCGSAI